MATEHGAGHAAIDAARQAEENKAIFRRFYERAWNAAEPSAVDEFLNLTFVNHMLPPESTHHREHYRQAILENHRLFPDYALTFSHVVAENDLVAAHWRTYCTVGEGAPPGLAVGTPLETTGMTLVRMRDRRITDFWKYDNAATVLAQAAHSAASSSSTSLATTSPQGAED